MPLLKDPASAGKSGAIGRFRNGDTIRTEEFRFTEYTTEQGKRVSTMLYDHRADPNENVNVAGAAKNTKVAERLSVRLRKNTEKLSDAAVSND